MGRRITSRGRVVLAGIVTALVAVTGVGLVLGPAIAGAEPDDGGHRTRAIPPVHLDAAVAAHARVTAENALRDAAAAQHLAAVAEYYRPKTGVNWDGIARCETGGNWSMRGSRFSGGLGFYNGTWTAFGGREFAPNAGMATREQQIVVAERVYARYGLSGWGCRTYG